MSGNRPRLGWDRRLGARHRGRVAGYYGPAGGFSADAGSAVPADDL